MTATRTRPPALARAIFGALLLVAPGIKAADAGETLYNGIVLPREWPPRLADFPTSVEKDPVVPPYLISPPEVIPIDVGRQLFVDDFLIAETTLKRTLLTLTPHVKRGKIKVGEQLIIEALPSGEKFQTELLEQGNRLRARSEIAQFYRDAKVNEGDYVLLSEVASGRWTLKKAPPGKYGLSALVV